MGWINYTSQGGTAGLADFASTYPDAVVVTSDVDNGFVAANYDVGGWVCKVYAIQHTKVTEYRGLTEATAESLKAGVATCDKQAYTTTHSTSGATMWAKVPMLIGVERNVAVSRVNEAAGYRLTVTETTIASGDVTADWVQASQA